MGLGTKTDLSLDLNSNRHNDIGQDAQQNCWLNEETDKQKNRQGHALLFTLNRVAYWKFPTPNIIQQLLSHSHSLPIHLSQGKPVQ